ncbi:biotin--[acetyl-CoA-carboxylase] ligase [Aeromicrobium duanguangcaii]|uniref:biotin--[biotin carboxyl-carrier protein] ligase n=1 Tax=Aeromicrobium duanguangcaii TaxID=2968086 RepID=A0ABY5KE05_9ACTN|nr:biotin--[acetyl-CoA-carboxylase] ligase [Aeromicrobium duanguangcaii]MCD9155339.1 biotin--[acetyl-CoA-carboxylase] ligase [Aeromicrobium duanguangcaii]UUI68013.1 biotin--[acetyl-CoA-carboxylase] ligase [Aeromicrobium duanguangcaii]
MQQPQREPLDRDRLADVAPGFTVHVTQETASTNADLASAARDGAPEWSVHTTDHQAAGRGRLDRTFTMPPLTGIAVSVLVRPVEVPPARWPWLPLVTGLAVVDAVREVGVDAALKWPNDVLIDDRRKLCGILVERVETSQGPAAVIGVGLNVALTAEDLPVETATSLWLEGATTVDRAELLGVLLSALRTRLEQWRDPARQDELARAYADVCSTIGRQVRIQRPDGSDVVGEATGIDESGRIVVDGIAWSAGDVTHLRPV